MPAGFELWQQSFGKVDDMEGIEAHNPLIVAVRDKVSGPIDPAAGVEAHDSNVELSQLVIDQVLVFLHRGLSRAVGCHAQELYRRVLLSEYLDL